MQPDGCKQKNCYFDTKKQKELSILVSRSDYSRELTLDPSESKKFGLMVLRICKRKCNQY